MELHSEYRSKEVIRFLRTGRKIFVAEPDVTSTTHAELAQEHKIDAELEKLRQDNPTQVDGGFIGVTDYYTLALGKSSSLALPPYGHEKEAREITGEVLKEILPNHTVRSKL